MILLYMLHQLFQISNLHAKKRLLRPVIHKDPLRLIRAKLLKPFHDFFIIQSLSPVQTTAAITLSAVFIYFKPISP